MKDVNINEQVLMTLECLRPDVADENIMFSLVMCTDLWTTRIEPADIQRTIAALIADSCKLHSCVGRITIETANVSLGSSDFPDGESDLMPGEYVMLSLSHNGSSLSTATSKRFIKTLHEKSHLNDNTPATRLSIYEFIRKSGGDIICHDKQGPEGTKVSLFFPRYSQQKTFKSPMSRSESSAMKQLI